MATDVAFIIPRVDDNSNYPWDRQIVIREYKHAGNRQPGSPYTLAEILGLLREEAPDINTHVIDAQIDELSISDVKEQLRSLDPELVIGFLSCFDIPTERAYIELEEYRTMGIITPCTVDAADAVRIYDLDVDYFTRTEVENTILQTVTELKDTGSIEETPGLYINTTEEIYHTGPPEWWEDDFPMPAFEQANFQKYYDIQTKVDDDPYLLLNTTKGCPFNCSFCMSAASELSTIKPAEQVLDELEYLHELTGAQRFEFIDDEFPIRLDRAKDICRGMIEFDWDVRFQAMNRVEFLDTELIRLADQAGCYQMSFGIETGDPVVQKEINKELDFEHAKEMFDVFYDETDIDVRAFMTVGLPGEREETLEKNKGVVKYLNLDDVSGATICFPAPGTPLYNQMKAEGRLLVEDWSKYKSPDGLLFDHEYYDSLKEIEAVRDEFLDWFEYDYQVHRALQNPTPKSIARAGIDKIKTYDSIRNVVKKSQIVGKFHDGIYERLGGKTS